MSTTTFGSGRRHQGERGGGSKGHTPIEDKVDGRNGCDDALWVDDEYITLCGSGDRVRTAGFVMTRPLLGSSFMGTLKSTRMRTRLPGMASANAGSSTKSLLARDMVGDGEQDGIGWTDMGREVRGKVVVHGRLQLARTRIDGDGGDDDGTGSEHGGGAGEQGGEEEAVCEPRARQDGGSSAGRCGRVVVDAHWTDGWMQEKPSEEELAERMQRIKEQNEKIKQRRLVSSRIGRGE